jgi:hypothetical protein
MSWTGHVAGTGKMRNVYKIVVGKPEGKKPFEDLGVDTGIILKWILGIHPAHDRNQWKAAVNTALYLMFP